MININTFKRNIPKCLTFFSKLKIPSVHKNFCSCVEYEHHGKVTRNENNYKVLNHYSADLSDVVPNHSQSFNLAAYVNNSDILKNLMSLNVNLAKIEKKPYIVEKILKLDFDRDIKNHIFFLKDYVDNESIGSFITKNPLILCEAIIDLEIRINYLQSKHFTCNGIRRIIAKNPYWLMFSTVRIDKRLGYFQKTFGLTGNEVRYLATKQPQLITYNLHHITTNSFVIKEEMGFNDKEVKELILGKPKLWMMNQRSLLERFKFIHNTMKISHEHILQNANILTYRNFVVRQRHLFLDKLGRAQYDPKKENYVPLKELCNGTDVEFCTKYTRSNIDDFNAFLKTL